MRFFKLSAKFFNPETSALFLQEGESQRFKYWFIWEMSEFRGKDLIFRDEIKWKF
jgi:hypothetical protein